MSQTLFIDIETNGLPETAGFNKYYEPSDTRYYDNSRVLELAYIIYDKNGILIKSKQFVITPDGFTVTNSHIHGITEEIIANDGKSIHNVLEEFEKDLVDVNLIVAHNLLFDMNIMMSECYRYEKNNLINILSDNVKFDCTMNKGKKHFKLLKSPKLVDLYEKLFNKKIEQKHRALSDAEICADCYYKMKQINRNKNV